MDETRIPGRPSFPPTRIGAPRKVSKKKFQIQDKLHQEREDRVVEALSTAGPAPVPPRYFCDFKQIRIRTATFWRWRSLAQELGLEGDEQMASYLLNMYYEYVRKAASEEEKRDIPQNSKEARQRIETSLLQDDQKGIETDDIESTILPTQGTQDGSIGLHQGKYPSDSMKERSKDGWRGDGDGTDDGGKKVLEGEFTCLVKAEPDQSDEEFNQHGTLASCSQQEDDWTGGDDDNGQKIVGREFTCLIKEEPDDSDRESNQPSCSQQGGDLRQQSSYHMEQTLKISGDTSHDRSHEEHLPQDFPIQAVLGNHFDLSTGGDCSSEHSGMQRSCQSKEYTLKMSGDASHDRSHGEHLPGDFPLHAVPGHHSDLCDRGSCSSEYDSYVLPNLGDYSQGKSAADSATYTTLDDHQEGIVGSQADNALELGEKCETASSKNVNTSCHSAEENLFKCSVCNKEYNRKHNLSRHMRVHSGERPHECSICNKRFMQSSELKRHVRIHTGEKPYSCSVCDKHFRDTSNLKAHMAIHVHVAVNKRKKRHCCPFCREEFSNRRHRDAHCRIHHTEKVYHCTTCDMRFNRFDSLQNHTRTHTGEKPYVCSSCNKAFSQSCFLTTHKRIHTGEKPYECSVCGERFSFNTQLVDHETKHTGVKPYFCSICERRFWRKSCLNRHKLVHTGEKSFQCSVCGKCFAQKSTLNKHLKTHKYVNL